MDFSNDTSLALMQAANAKASGKAAEATQAVKDKNDARIEAAARDFEALFVAQMLKPMFEGIEVNNRFGGGKGEEIFRSFMIDEYGKMIAETGQLGIADAIKQQLIQMQSDASQ